MARSTQARICILMRLSESLWIRAAGMRPLRSPANTRNSRAQETTPEEVIAEWREADKITVDL